MSSSGWSIIDKDAGVLSLTYAFSKQGTSTTFAVRMGDGRMLVVSPAMGLSDADAAALTAFGEVGAVVANNGFHHMGVAEWRARYPAARCFAPATAIARIAKKNPGAGTFEPLSALAELTGPDVGFRDVPDAKVGESWFWAKVAGGHAWYLSDTLANIERLPSFLPVKLLFKWTKSAPGFRVFNLALKFLVKDKKATLRLLLDDLAAHPPAVIVPAHGAPVSGADVVEKTRAAVHEAM